MVGSGAEKRQVLKFKNGNLTAVEDVVASEVNIRIVLQCEVIGTLTCTPSNLKELAVGYLITSGLVNDENKLIHLDFVESESKFDVTLQNNNILHQKEYSVVKPLGCASGDILFIRADNKNLKMPNTSIEAIRIGELMRQFNKSSELFLTTGGVHSCALANSQEILVCRDDVGRHNAVDKVIGALYLQDTTCNGLVLLTTGRISSEIVLKAINARLSIIVSRSAPTSRAIELAEQYGLTLVGFARGGNFNIYCCPEKVGKG
jgi:FdhD protein